MIRHVVLMKFVDAADAPSAQARLEALPAAIPQLLSLQVGLDTLHTDASYDLWLITTHDSVEALEEYQVHPVHLEFRSWVGPRLAGRVVVDSAE